jgi:outer membrane protein assembly factor BamB
MKAAFASNRSRLSTRTLWLVCGLIGALLLVGARGAQADVGGDWVQYMHDNGRTGFNPNEVAITPSNAGTLQQLWQVSTPETCQDFPPATGPCQISAQPVVTNGRLYWGSWDGYEHASNPLTGTEIWKTYIGDEYKADCSPPHIGVASTATIATVPINGQQRTVDFVGGGDGSYYALDAGTGAVIWSHNFGSPQDGYFSWSSVAVYSGSLYVGISSTGDCPLVQGRLVKLDPATGQEQASFKVVPDGCTGGGIWTSPAIDAATGMVFATTGTNGTCTVDEPLAQAIIQLRASDLSLVASFKDLEPSHQISDGDFGASPTLFTATINGQTRRLVGAANKNGIYYALDRTNVGAGPVWESARISTDPSTIATSAWDGTRLYVGGFFDTVNGQSCDGTVKAIDPSTGAFLWNDCFGNGYGEVVEGLTAVPGLVLAGVGQHLVVINSTNGNVLFDYADGSGWWFYAPPTVSNGVIYAGQSNGKLYAFTPSGQPPAVPGAPALSATAGNATTHLSWTAPSDGGSPITGYRIYRATASGGETLLTPVSGSTLSYDDNNLTNGTTYYYRVSAVNGAGEGALSNEASATPQGGAPSAPTLSASAGNATVHLSWTAPSDGGSPITGYRIYRATASGGEKFLRLVNASTLSFDDNSVSNGTTYYYRVSAVNGAGEGALSNEASATPQPQLPGAPTNLQAASANGKGVQLTWKAPTGSTVSSYSVYRATASASTCGAPFTRLTSTGGTSLKDTATTRNSYYCYYVTAVNTVGEGPKSNTAGPVRAS